MEKQTDRETEDRGDYFSTILSPQISASVPRSRRPPLRWERCSTPPPPDTITCTWKREREGGEEREDGHIQRRHREKRREKRSYGAALQFRHKHNCQLNEKNEMNT